MCESDADEQLLLNIPFSQVVKLHSIAVAGSPDDSGAFAPKTIHLYVNRPSMGFSDCESTKPTQTIELASADETTVDLAYVKFQNVHTLSVFIADNQGDEEGKQTAIVSSRENTNKFTQLTRAKTKSMQSRNFLNYPSLERSFRRRTCLTLRG